jgi:hypothetical protein
MADLSKLSDDELRAMAAQREVSRRSLSSLSDDELRAAAYVQPKPPPGVTMHTQGGPVFIGRDGKPQKSTMAEAEARMLRERDGIGGDVADSVLRGVPFVGEFMPRARAAMQGGDYGQNLEREQARAKTFDADYPIASLGGKATGAIGGTVAALPLMAQGGVTGAVANTLFGGGASSAMGAVARGGVAGALQGAAQGVGQSTDLTNYSDVAGNAAKDAAFGGILGAAIPGAVSAGAAATQYVRGLGGDALSSVPRPAARWAERQFNDPAKLAQMRQGMSDLGPDAMLADVSPEMASVARGAAARPGTRDLIVNALNSRDAGKNARIGAAVNSNFGPDAVPSQVLAEVKAAQQALSPAYERAFAGAKAVDTTQIANKLEAIAVGKRGEAADAAMRVREMLNIRGTDQLDPNPKTLHEIRMAIDGMMGSSTDGNVRRVLGETRKAIDDELAAKVPGIKPIDSKYAEISREAEAFATGQRSFDSGREGVLRPSELAAEQARLVNPAGSASGPPTRGGLDRLSQGARSEVERIVGTKSNDVAALNQLLRGEGDWNRDKLRLLFGQDKADRVLKVLDAERVMEATRNRVVGNSETQATKGFSEFIDNASRPTRVDPNMSLFGALMAGAKKGVDRLSGNRAEAQAEMFAEALSRLPVAQRAEADALIRALMTRAQRSQQSAAVNQAAGVAGPNARLIEALMGANGSDQRDRRTSQR